MENYHIQVSLKKNRMLSLNAMTHHKTTFHLTFCRSIAKSTFKTQNQCS